MFYAASSGTSTRSAANLPPKSAADVRPTASAPGIVEELRQPMNTRREYTGLGGAETRRLLLPHGDEGVD